MWGWALCETIIQELRYGARTLRKSPGFAATAILTLALGIGASTAVFTVVDSVLLKPLGYHEAGSLVACWERVRFLGEDATGPNPRHVEVWRQSATAFSGLTHLQNVAMGLALRAEHPFLTSALRISSIFSAYMRFSAVHLSPKTASRVAVRLRFWPIRYGRTCFIAIPARSVPRSGSATFRAKWWAYCLPASIFPTAAPCAHSGVLARALALRRIQLSLSPPLLTGRNSPGMEITETG